eukprot:TRINITY_DN16541_c1_g1_i1.p1 TRINITY_DN16541_c1_g1~~TRINITY_DN16541_c1_g1_i1.p1  ORF type:complete len:115 (-),score=8.48 TRINITY_DN16541_c1_g1_i1:42-386(-)
MAGSTQTGKSICKRTQNNGLLLGTRQSGLRVPMRSVHMQKDKRPHTWEGKHAHAGRKLGNRSLKSKVKKGYPTNCASPLEQHEIGDTLYTSQHMHHLSAFFCRKRVIHYRYHDH